MASDIDYVEEEVTVINNAAKEEVPDIKEIKENLPVNVSSQDVRLNFDDEVETVIKADEEERTVIYEEPRTNFEQFFSQKCQIWGTKPVYFEMHKISCHDVSQISLDT